MSWNGGGGRVKGSGWVDGWMGEGMKRIGRDGMGWDRTGHVKGGGKMWCT